MRQDDRVTQVTFTLPAGHKWTTVEAALQEAHDQEYELRMAFFWECERLREQVERLTKAGDAMADEIVGCFNAEGYDPADSDALTKWNAAKEGKPNA